MSASPEQLRRMADHIEAAPRPPFYHTTFMLLRDALPSQYHRMVSAAYNPMVSGESVDTDSLLMQAVALRLRLEARLLEAAEPTTQYGVDADLAAIVRQALQP